MKNCFFALVFFYCFSIFAEDVPPRTTTLASGIITTNDVGYFFMADGSCWKVTSLYKRNRSIKEWWNKVQLPVPQNYECTPKDWVTGTQIEICPKDRDAEVYAEYATNKEDLRQCSHLLINLANQNTLYAISVEPSACISAIYQDAYDKGVHDGYHKGKLAAEQRYTEGYAQGYQVGSQYSQDNYNRGYQQGWNDRQRQQYP